MREEKISFMNSRRDTLSGVLHHPNNKDAQGAAILCHGMESNKESQKLVMIGEALSQRGILTLRFDFSYVGESSGKFEDLTHAGEVEDLRAAYALVQTRRGGKTAILGSSMGGTVALLFAAEEANVAAVVTISAPIHPERFPKRKLTIEQFQQWRDRGFIIYNGKRFNVSLLHDLEKLNVPEATKKITCPVLILHGEADAVVPVEEAYDLYGYLPNSKKLIVLKGADHRLSDPASMAQAVTQAIDWLCQHVR
jgi:alpha/beta superfamily hydrolase